MRRLLANGLGVAAIPVGVGLGLWMAQLTTTQSCTVIGLGMRNFCEPRAALAPSWCVLAGAASAAVLLLLAIAVRRPASTAWAFDLAAAEAGIAIGLLASLATYPLCGPTELCIGGVIQRFTSWESALIGAAAAAGIVALGCLAYPGLRRANLDAARRTQSWLFRDLSPTVPVEASEPHTAWPSAR